MSFTLLGSSMNISEKVIFDFLKDKRKREETSTPGSFAEVISNTHWTSEVSCIFPFYGQVNTISISLVVFTSVLNGKMK